MAKVRIIAINPKYRTIPYFCVPVYDEEARNYNTGQQDLSPADLKKEPIIIEPESQYAIKHMQVFDTNNRKDALILNLARTQLEVAVKSNKVVPGKHLFYIENLEEEAGERITKTDKMFDALTKVKENSSLGKQRDIAVFLSIPTNQPANVIQDRIYIKCQNDPDDVLEFFNPNSQLKIFVRKLIANGIITKRDSKYVDGTVFLGRDETEVLHFLQDKKNDPLIAKWGIQLEKVEGSVTNIPSSPAITKTPVDKKVDMKLNELNKFINEDVVVSE